VDLLPGDPEAHSNLGAALRRAGEQPAALESFQRALQLSPNFPDALLNAGDLLFAGGQLQQATILYTRALRGNPRWILAQVNLGNAQYEQGDFPAAAESYRAALKITPDDAMIHANLGNALLQLGRAEEALRHGHQAVELDPGLAEAHNILGLAHAARGEFDQAVSCYRAALAHDPNYVDALNNLGNALRDLGERRESIRQYSRAIELDSQRADSHCNLGNVYFEMQRLEEAVASYLTALALRPDYRAAHLSLAMALRMLGRATEAETSCRAALAIDPNYVEAIALLGELRADMGQFEQAHALFQRAIAVKPDFPFVYFNVAMHRKMTLGDTEWLANTHALLSQRLPLRHEISLRYARGKYFDDIKHYDEAFANYQRANELTKRGGLHYDAAKLSLHVDKIIAGFDAASIARFQALGDASERPVFIVGMPRSGTSLAEQILASHPQVFGAGELQYWDNALSTHQTAVQPGGDAESSVPRIAADYLQRLAGWSGDAQRVVDKMPPNFMNLGLIHSVFPHARIIHMRRHPIDTCLSIYFQYFLNTHPYSNDLANLAHYYGEYLRIMDHWRRTLPAAALLEVRYEDLIGDQEAWSRRMIEFIGLPWDARCLDFHETSRVVLTASKWQVRQKVHSNSAGRWRNYQKFAGPLHALALDEQLLKTGK
jgi:tetratricopeptide (TPR) repeat protein